MIARGIERCRIFGDDRDRAEFVSRLAKVLVECCVTCFAWALMPNHVHLAVRTGEQPLATAMARLLTGYAGYFNRRHERVGHLFQNRYRSILVVDDAHLLSLVRYIHRNPLRAGIVHGLDELADYPWTGHAALMGTRSPAFQATEPILSRFGSETVEACVEFERWMALEHEARPPAAAPPADALARLIERACLELGTRVDDVLGASRGGVASDVRALVAFLACRSCGFGPTEIGRRLGVSHTAIRKAIARGGILIEQRPELHAIASSAPPGCREEGVGRES